MKVYSNQLTQKIQLILVPLIGELMTTGVLKVQTRNLGITEESITLKVLPQLSEGIRHGLVMFLGTQVSAQVAKKISELK
jgi:hypothetical protein